MHMFTGQESCQVNFIDKSPYTHHEGLCLARIQQLRDPIPIHPHQKNKTKTDTEALLQQRCNPVYRCGQTYPKRQQGVRKGDDEHVRFFFFLNVSKDLLSDR